MCCSEVHRESSVTGDISKPRGCKMACGICHCSVLLTGDSSLMCHQHACQSNMASNREGGRGLGGGGGEGGREGALPVAIVRCRPDSDKLLIEHELIALHHQLMRSCNKVYFIGLTEGMANVTAKEVPSASRAQTPPLYIFWVAP